jgi:nucleoside-diphosphate-sugar epimerase
VTGKVLVTGASGGLGLSLVEALSRAGRSVVGVGRRAGSDPRLRAAGVHYVRCDLTDPKAGAALCAGVETIFHCAALSSPWDSKRTFEQANVEMTRRLLTRARDAGVRTFVHVSSPSIYAEMRDRVAITERDPPAARPLNHYARTKLAAEQLVLAAGGAMRTVILRPRAIVGPDDGVLLPRLIELVRRRTVPLPRGGQARVEFTHVADAVAALILAERHADEAHGQAINISGGHPVSVGDVASGLAAVLGIDTRRLNVPMPLAHALAWGTEGAHRALPLFGEPRLTRYALATLAYTQTFNLDLARRILHWQPAHDGFAALLEEARRWR